MEYLHASLILHSAGKKITEKAIRIDPKRISEILKVCKKYGFSHEEYQQLVPEDAESRKIFASLLDQQRNWKASKAEYRKAIELSGKQPEYYEIMQVISMGYPDENSVLEPYKGSFDYWKDETGEIHVPKRSLNEVIYKIL